MYVLPQINGNNGEEKERNDGNCLLWCEVARMHANAIVQSSFRSVYMCIFIHIYAKFPQSKSTSIIRINHGGLRINKKAISAFSRNNRNMHGGSAFRKGMIT